MRNADTLPPPCAVVMKCGNLNYLEPSEPLQACNGTDLPLPLPFLDIGEWLISLPGRFHLVKETCTCQALVWGLNTGPSSPWPRPYHVCYATFMCVVMPELSERSVPHP